MTPTPKSAFARAKEAGRQPEYLEFSFAAGTEPRARLLLNGLHPRIEIRQGPMSYELWWKLLVSFRDCGRVAVKGGTFS